MTARSRQRRVSPATTWLIRAFSPGCPTMLRSWQSRRADGLQRLTIFFDLPNADAQQRAAELAASAPTLRLVRIGKTTIRDLAAQVSGEQRTLTVEAQLSDDLEGAAE